MQVLEAGHDVALQPNCVYVITNNKLLKIKNCKLQLSEKNFEKSPNTAIDTFFKSLASYQGANAIAVILSGTGTDETKGIEAIQERGDSICTMYKIRSRQNLMVCLTALLLLVIPIIF